MRPLLVVIAVFGASCTSSALSSEAAPVTVEATERVPVTVTAAQEFPDRDQNQQDRSLAPSSEDRNRQRPPAAPVLSPRAEESQNTVLGPQAPGHEAPTPDGQTDEGVPCVAAPLTVLPLDQADIVVILPLGNLNPPGHTHPTDHIYYGLPREQSGQQSLVDVRAPGEGRVTSIDVSSADRAGVLSFDYSLRIELCDAQSLKFGHVTGLSAPLLEALDSAEASFCNAYGDSEVQYEYCSLPVDVIVSAGDLIGTAGGPTGTSAALDLWMYDTSLPPNGLLGESDRSDAQHTRCPLDYFTDDLRGAQEQLLGGWDGTRRTIGPICGEFVQDLVGSAQGNWYSTSATPGAWDGHLALVHDNVDPRVAVISVGGVVAGVGVWTFTPRPEGQINRDFAEVGADGTVFCYEKFETAPDSNRRFLVQLVDDGALLVEQQAGSCSSDSTFVSPTSYGRQPL